MSDAAEYVKDTIVAVATPPGRGGVGIVRLSGPDAGDILTAMTGSLPKPRLATYRQFLDADGRAIDSGLVLWFPEPNSFTGESVAELHGHGGPMVMSMLTEAAVRMGARRAEPGEFSQRAFLNGRLDLVQAEAISDLIDSGTTQAARAAHRSLSGVFSGAVHALTEQLIRLRLHVEAAIDFPEEEIDFLKDEALQRQIDQCQSAFDELVIQAGVGRLLRDGLQIVIAGKPNAGKSSLLNQLSGQNAAIVTEVAGTTRDVLRERIDLGGLTVELVDTAGLRDNPDTIEAEGIRRARQVLATADAAIWIQDATIDEPAAPDDSLPAIPVVILRNKIDITGEDAGMISDAPLVINVSARTGDGLDDLRSTLKRLAGYRDAGEGAFTARQRHVDALNRAREHFDTGRNALDTDHAGEILAEELRLAQDALSAITGAFTSDDLLGRIFAEFCIGK